MNLFVLHILTHSVTQLVSQSLSQECNHFSILAYINVVGCCVILSIFSVFFCLLDVYLYVCFSFLFVFSFVNWFAPMGRLSMLIVKPYLNINSIFLICLFFRMKIVLLLGKDREKELELELVGSKKTTTI